MFYKQSHLKMERLKKKSLTVITNKENSRISKQKCITRNNYAIIQLLSFVLPFMETITDLEVVGKGFIQKDNIKKLTVMGIAPSLDVLIRIFDRCSQLTHLTFKNRNVSDTIVDSLLSRVVVTESLSFDRCFRITQLPFSNSTSS